MKFLFSFFIAVLFLLTALLENHGFFNIGVLNIFGAKQLGGLNMYFLEVFVDKILIIPGILYHLTKDFIGEYKPEGYFFSDTYIKLYIVGLYYFIFTYIVLLLSNIFSFHRDKVYLSILIVAFYLLVIYII